MGAHTFTDEAFGKDATEAYGRAVSAALHEYGHNGYNGTISTTAGFVVVTKPKNFTDDEFIDALMWAELDCVHGKWNHAENIPVLSQRRKFSSEWDRRHYQSKRALLNKWKRLTYDDKKAIVHAANTLQKWGPCVAWRADRKTETTYRDRNGLKGKHGGVWMFFGWAAS